MAVSPTGMLMLLFIIGVGPIYYGVKWLIDKRHGPGLIEEEKAAEEEDEADEVDTTSYILGLLGYAIGIGNVWRFPYLVGKYGGGAFVFAYLLCLFTCALPLFMLELGLGQWTHKFFIDTYNTIRPRWRGLGYAQAFMLFMLTSYYNVLIAYALVFAFSSVIDPLPWAARYWSAF